METLLQAKRLPVALAKEIGDCDIDSALSNLEHTASNAGERRSLLSGPVHGVTGYYFKKQASSKE